MEKDIPFNVIYYVNVDQEDPQPQKRHYQQLSILSIAIVLRIDNSGRSVIYTFYHNSETTLAMITCDIPNKRGYFSSSFDRSVIEFKFDVRFKTVLFHFYFFNMNISLAVYGTEMKFLTGVENIHTEGTVSQILDSGLSLDFI